MRYRVVLFAAASVASLLASEALAQTKSAVLAAAARTAANVEELRDGASALYGSDAIAGVINIGPRQADHGGGASVTYGEHDTDINFFYGGRIASSAAPGRTSSGGTRQQSAG
jgi:outer membrane cobalamin receptor